ncbi:MAG: hypothetical protein QNJ98_07260 [Planctomycetota bacterium]|nr:hypothetical protein [Planctomycetota bacterium]
MDPFERYTRRSLRDVLVSQGALSQEAADELIESAYESNEAFGAVIVEAGLLTAWDLAKTVSTHYQMPILPLLNYQFDESVFETVSPATLYQYMVLPVGRFGRTWSFSVVEPPSRECIDALREACGSSIFFFVSELQEVQRALQEHVKVVDVQSDTSWQSIFDTGERRVNEEIAHPGE